MLRKPLGPTARRRKAKARRLKADENKNKQQVRARDGHRCRFPLCPCHLKNLFLEVSHHEHKGMGGDPTGERSLPEKMILVCNWRHKESLFSIDKEQIRWVALTDAGANGPVAWEMKDGFYHWRRLIAEVNPGDLALPDAWGEERLHFLTVELLEGVK